MKFRFHVIHRCLPVFFSHRFRPFLNLDFDAHVIFLSGEPSCFLFCLLLFLFGNIIDKLSDFLFELLDFSLVLALDVLCNLHLG